MGDIVDLNIHRLLGPTGRILGASKGRLKHYHPEKVYIFNANVHTANDKIWYGDLNFSNPKDVFNLKRLSETMNETLYIYSEVTKFLNSDDLNKNYSVAIVETDGTVNYNLSDLQINPDDTAIYKNKKYEAFDPSAYIEKFSLSYIDKSDILITVQLEDKYEANGKESPMVTFYKHIAEQTNKNTQEIDVSQVYVSKNRYKDLVRAEVDYLEKDMDDYELKQAMGWVLLQYGPGITDVDDDKVYITGFIND